MKWLSKVSEKVSKKARKVYAMSLMACVAMFTMVTSASAAVNTGDTDVDSALSAFEGAFETLKTGFWYLALAAIPITLAVLAFFWLRGKFKQAVSGA